ncbi:50S ribosomal protein L32 [PVC group bacterium (ex Bugula neritina AB1)]|nr:50S ribosomal protein L32 [PVC group bacterium (ex Bugula neritina AB1)]
MAVPVKKTSRTEKNIRRHSQKKKIAYGVSCSQCGEPRRPHIVCVKCGYYKGKKVLSVTGNA